VLTAEKLEEVAAALAAIQNAEAHIEALIEGEGNQGGLIDGERSTRSKPLRDMSMSLRKIREEIDSLWS
jgi:hypothetical protein